MVRKPVASTSVAEPAVAATSSSPSSLAGEAAPRMPRLICFDLDYTLWPLWVDTHVDPPIKRKKQDDVNLVYDRNNSRMSFYRDVPSILLQLKNADEVHVAIASRTSAPRAAEQALDQLLIPSQADSDNEASDAKLSLMRSMECFNTREIYPGSKIRHFKEIHKKTSIPYEEMVFYDDESRNREVSTLGVTFVLVPEGVNRRIFEKGLQDWRTARSGQHDKVFVEKRGGRK